MNVTILHLFPDLMNLYGDWGNVAMLGRTLEQMGHTVTVHAPHPGEDLALKSAHVIYMGAGMESRGFHALETLKPQANTLQSLVEAGVPMVFCGTAMDLLGKTITAEDGTVYQGLGICDFTTVQGSRRLVGDVMGDCPVTDRPVVGYCNTASRFEGIDTPLLTALSLGDTAGAGLLYHNVVGAPLTGPLLVKNPELLRYVVTTLLHRNGVEFESVPLAPAAVAGHEVTVTALQNRAGNG